MFWHKWSRGTIYDNISDPAGPLHPSTPWQRVHVDFAGPFAGKMFLIVWMHIRSGQKCTSCPVPQLPRQLLSYEKYLPGMIFLTS